MCVTDVPHDIRIIIINKRNLKSAFITHVDKNNFSLKKKIKNLISVIDWII